MIKIRIKNADHEIDVQFPISENKLYAKLAEIHAIEGKDAPQSAFVTEVYWPEELSMLKDRFANLDELNYLARRMESFDYHEYDQFLIGITKLENPTEKDLINLTFNLDHFTLCKDVSNYGKIGREYVMNTEGAVPAHDEDDPKYQKATNTLSIFLGKHFSVMMTWSRISCERRIFCVALQIRETVMRHTHSERRSSTASCFSRTSPRQSVCLPIPPTRDSQQRNIRWGSCYTTERSFSKTLLVRLIIWKEPLDKRIPTPHISPERFASPKPR